MSFSKKTEDVDWKWWMRWVQTDARLSLIWLKKGGAHRGPALGGDYQGHVDF